MGVDNFNTYTISNNRNSSYYRETCDRTDIEKQIVEGDLTNMLGTNEKIFRLATRKEKEQPP